MPVSRLIVIGGDAAGMSAASQARRLDSRMEIRVFERSPHTSYSACGLPYFAAGMVEEANSLVARTPERFRQQYDIEAMVGHEVLAIDPQARRVRVRVPETGKEFEEGFDTLLIATGARPHWPEIPGCEGKGIYALSTLQSGIELRRALDERPPRNAVIVGGGYIGLEMAEALLARGIPTSLVQRGVQPMNTLDPDMGALVARELKRRGVNLYLEEPAVAFELEGGRVCAVRTSLRRLPADLVVLGLGVIPESALAKEAGIELGVKGAIRVDEGMRTNLPGIFAAGDCVSSLHRVSGQEVHVALGTLANRQGMVAGQNIAGQKARFPGTLGTAITKVCELEIARTGLQERELEALGIDYAAVTIKSRTRSGYYPGVSDIHVKLLGEKGSGRLLGGQILGGAGAGKRIDTLAACLWAKLAVEELVQMDLSYAPPFSPVWDPVATAARALVKKL